MNADQNNPDPESDPRPRVVNDRECFIPVGSMHPTIIRLPFVCRRVTVEGSDDGHATIAVSAYHIANLLAAIEYYPNTGDWHHQIPAMLREAHVALGEPELLDNEGRVWGWANGEFAPVTERDVEFYITDNPGKDSEDVAEHFGITATAASNICKQLLDEGAIGIDGQDIETEGVSER